MLDGVGQMGGLCGLWEMERQCRADGAAVRCVGDGAAGRQRSVCEMGRLRRAACAACARQWGEQYGTLVVMKL